MFSAQIWYDLNYQTAEITTITPFGYLDRKVAIEHNTDCSFPGSNRWQWVRQFHQDVWFAAAILSQRWTFPTIWVYQFEFDFRIMDVLVLSLIWQKENPPELEKLGRLKKKHWFWMKRIETKKLLLIPPFRFLSRPLILSPCSFR